MYLLCLITTPKKCIIPLKVNQFSTILSKPLSKKEKIAKMCEKKCNNSPQNQEKYSKIVSIKSLASRWLCHENCILH